MRRCRKVVRVRTTESAEPHVHQLPFFLHHFTSRVMKSWGTQSEDEWPPTDTIAGYEGGWRDAMASPMSDGDLLTGR